MAKWDARFLEMAELVSSWSKDPSTKVGCIIVNSERTVLSVGFNGLPRGVEDTSERLNNRETKYRMVQHAEANAIQNSQGNLRGATAYVTHKPCSNCCGALIQAGIAKIVTKPPLGEFAERFKESYEATDAMIKEVGIEYQEN